MTITDISVLITIGIVSFFWWGSSNADTGARSAMRVGGSLLALTYFIASLWLGWWIPLGGVGILFVAIVAWDFVS